MKKNTREKLLEQAHKLFSEKGFYGTSINDIAAEVQVSKQGLLHHFASKEKLYGAVLAQAADTLHGFVSEAKNRSDQGQVQLQHLLMTMTTASDTSLSVIILLMRELLDNRDRAEKAQKWYLRPFLDELVKMVETGQQQGAFKHTPPLAFVYQLLGATQYYLISTPTLRQLYSDQEFNHHQQAHLRLLNKMICGD